MSNGVFTGEFTTKLNLQKPKALAQFPIYTQKALRKCDKELRFNHSLQNLCCDSLYLSWINFFSMHLIELYLPSTETLNAICLVLRHLPLATPQNESWKYW